MNSETSTDPVGFRPWHFFVLAGTLAATAAVFLTREAPAAHILLVTAAIWSAVLAGLALHRTLVPFADEHADSHAPLEGRTRAALQAEKMLVLRSIKELEFDRAMGKVSAKDFDEMVARLRARALALLARLDDTDGHGYRDLIERELRARLTSDRVQRAGAVAPADAEPNPAAMTAAPGMTARATAQDRSVEAPDESIGAAMTQGVDVGVSCPACATNNDPDARFCKGCGEPLKEAARG